MALSNFFKNIVKDEYENKPVTLLSKNKSVILNQLEKTTYTLNDSDQELEFKYAFKIERRGFDSVIRDCKYKINNRTFTDLKGIEGNTIKRFDDGNDDVYEIIECGDGERFLFHYHSIPIFDSGDAEWDSICHVIIYRDELGINLIHCQHGYHIPRISIYVTLTKAGSDLTKWFEYLQWQDSF